MIHLKWEALHEGMAPPRCEGVVGCPNVGVWIDKEKNTIVCGECKATTNLLPPIKWDNRECEERLKGNCGPYELETPVATHEDIISILEIGWPTCPWCGEEMVPME